MLERVAQPDTVSTALFWTAVSITGLGVLFSAGPTLLKDVWKLTNGSSSPQTPSTSTADEPISLDIVMHYDLATAEGAGGLRWILPKQQQSLPDEQCKIALVALLYARTLVNQDETRTPLLERVGRAASQVLQGKGKFEFEAWTLHQRGMSVCVWPWTITNADIIPGPKIYTATLLSSPFSRRIKLSMTFRLELVLVPASALLAICAYANTLSDNDRAQLARVLLGINAYYQTNTKFSIGSEAEALKAPMPQL